MKKTKIIIPAMGLLLLSTAASISGTVAWFAVNTSVSVEGLNVRAKAEGGIVIAPYAYTASAVTVDSGEGNDKTDAAYVAPAANTFGAVADVELDVADLYPTSTNNTSNWYHAGSNSADSHAASTAYVDLTGQSTWESDGKLITGVGSHADPYKISGQYFQYSKFRVKSTTTVDSYSLYLRSLTVTADTNSALMNKSLRVALKVGAVTTFVAPKYTSDPGDLKWSNGTSAVAATVSCGLNPNVKVSADNAVVGNNGTSDPYVSAGIDLEIWVYYEGEDPNCKTINTEGITMDSLALTFTFATTAA